MSDRELSVYIHFLYCKSRCPYCDFFKKIIKKDFDECEYVKNILDNLDKMYKIFGKRDVKSIFFGGGTPSLLSGRAVSDILEGIEKYYNIKNGAEISLEANPNTFERDKFVSFKEAGINRLSLGVQALNEKDLKYLGRTHSVDEARKAIECGVKLFDKCSIDLIYARENQNFNEWKKEIDEAVSYGLKHISLYQLSIEEGTIFERKNIKAMDEELGANFYEDTVSYLRKKGFERYEVSNFSTDVWNRSTHNMVYWQGGDYIGLGVGAHGRIKYKDKIYATVDGRDFEELSILDRAYELVIMGLRIKDGINAKSFYEASGVKLFEFLNMEKLSEFKRLGLIEFDDYNVRLTDSGMLVLDKIIEEIVP